MVLVREIGVTVLRAVVIRHTVVPASSGGKLKTVLQTVASRRSSPRCPARSTWSPGWSWPWPSG